TRRAALEERADMNDRERVESLVDRIRSLAGLDEERFQRLRGELDRREGRFGYDEGGRLKLALFDAKSYDIGSFEGRNDGRFAIDPIEASLNEATAPAAEGHKVVCIFVNDTCDAKVAKALAAVGGGRGRGPSWGSSGWRFAAPASTTWTSRPAGSAA